MKKLNSRLCISALRIARATAATLLSAVWLSGCANTPADGNTDNPALMWNGTKDVRFLMAYQNETPEFHILNGMVRDSRGRRHELFDSHVDAQLIGADGNVVGEACAALRPLPRPRVIYRLARFSISIQKPKELVDEYRLYFHEAEPHC